MKKQFVTQEIALKLKELGFDEGCLAIYDSPEFKLIHELLGYGWNSLELTNGEVKNSIYSEGNFVTAPLWQQVIDWLRDTYNLHINFQVNQFGYGFMYAIIDLVQSKCVVNLKGGVNEKYTYPEAKEQAILEGIKIIKNRV